MIKQTTPAVRFPLKGCGVLVHVVYGLLAAGAGLLWAWWCWGSGAGVLWPGLLGCALWVVCAGLALQALKDMPDGGVLVWTGVHWQCEYAVVQEHWLEAPQVLCDCGWGLALRWQRAGQRSRYLWLQRDWAPAAWPGVRRAVYLPVHSGRNSHGPGALP